jgi:acetylornithine/succinyldiaminopimelate/putrescine aminotransferase
MTAAKTSLQAIRDYAGNRQTVGLSDDTLDRFVASDPTLSQAIEAALAAHEEMRGEYGDLLAGDESAFAKSLQSAFVNFYPPETVSPYVPLAARGPWIVTSHGAVLHDNGGYGMLGIGHAPKLVLDVLSQPHVMANVMTPNVSQKRFSERLLNEIGQNVGGCPFTHFICMNSGSEAVTVACRISDVNAWNQTRPEGPKAGQTVEFLTLEGSFHGRTDRPAQASDSCVGTYRKHLASHARLDNLLTVPVNDIDALRTVFAQAQTDGVFIELFLMEPVMGEGNPGVAVTPAFYDAARELTLAHGSLFLVDSIQAGLRSTGFLSIVDYPGFSSSQAPDLETYSKALNAGQYPMSVLAMTERSAALYRRGIYGNTMTTNPKALEVGCAVLDSLTFELRENIRVRGEQLVAGFRQLAAEFPGVVTDVQGTGLLCSCELVSTLEVVGFHGLETWLRKHGLGVIHGGENSLRFTPHFALTADEADLIVDLVRQGIRAFIEPDIKPTAAESAGGIEAAASK